MLYLSHKDIENRQCVKMWEKVVKGDTPTLFLIDYQRIMTNSHPKEPCSHPIYNKREAPKGSLLLQSAVRPLERNEFFRSESANRLVIRHCGLNCDTW